ncbi:MAG: T9SS type A sorting domain-containing protein [Bacteroidetes bacterium]|nr:T9SS type A sorting domain-containing protein [Bacteroidota bacterium]
MGGHVPYGIYDFINTRNNAALQQLQLNNISPMFSDTRILPLSPHGSDSIEIRTWVEDEDNALQVNLFFKVNWNGLFVPAPMYDDGQHGDENAGDGIYGLVLPPQNVTDTIYYYIESTDVLMATGREPRSGYNKIIVTNLPALYLNEWCAENTNVVQDNTGDYDDYFEIFNNGSLQHTHTIYASDDFSNLNKWNLGDTLIESNKFLLCWADDEKKEGVNHASFKLNAAGEQIILSEFNGKTYNLLDSVSFGNMPANQSLGYYPDGTLPVVVQPINTPGYSNLSAQAIKNNAMLKVVIFPNPTQGQLSILTNTSKPATCIIQNSLGQNLINTQFNNSLSINLSNYENGIYFVRIIIESSTYKQKLLLMKR